MSQLPDFPVDDATLLAVEHAMGGALAFEEDREDPVLVGADYDMGELLQFLSGQHGVEGVEEDGFVVMPGQCYHPHDVIAALITEVRSLRGQMAALTEPSEVQEMALSEVIAADVWDSHTGARTRWVDLSPYAQESARLTARRYMSSLRSFLSR